MANYPDDLRYTDDHEYVRLEGEIATIGITSFAVNQLGDIVFVELPRVGTEVSQGEELGTIESVKAVAEFYTPIGGTVIESNTTLEDSPELISDDPYGEGWLVKIRVNNSIELENTLSADEYQNYLRE
ncbi:Glycine cleavage system H protein [Planktothrix tepida]|uniref:Glycine cleavage system H protein n=3 Tax=Microcoleaceae TaxID=1892252 RepID=A0A1J1LVD3_9CYAN|nr:Glycine cleavage system H protein [Planktothrix pseudagardhii]CAD5978265.1 Glycine cleavage system H protein [Planktothrix tepida]CUR36066.1 Glycine cleavage system H protein [Planktothrix tepida PCC 9214]